MGMVARECERDRGPTSFRIMIGWERDMRASARGGAEGGVTVEAEAAGGGGAVVEAPAAEKD